MTDLEKVIEFIEIHGNGTNDGELTVDMVYKYAQALQLLQPDVSGSLPSLMKIYMNANSMKYQDFVELMRNRIGNDR